MSRSSLLSLARSALLCTGLAAAAPLAAQGVVAGTVTDPAGRPLSGVLIAVDGTNLRGASDQGRYRIVNVPAGSRTVTFRYIGYQTVSRTVTVTDGATATLDVKLEEAVSVLAAVEVRGQVVGQASALNQQRTAISITSVIDNELVGRLPDPNMAEALARVPGVAVVRDQGEGRFVQIRGTSADLNSLSINGMRLPTAEQNSRQLPMDIIPSDQAAQIQVSKTLTPDMDADAIGGNVNVVTRTARAGQTLLNFTSAGGRNQLGGGGLLNLGANAGKRFGESQKLGFMVGGTYYKNERASQNFEGDWCSQTRNCGTGASVTSLDAPNLWELRDYPQVDRLRAGANATLDYLLGSNSKLFLRGTYNTFRDDEIRFRTRYRFRGGSGSRWNLITPDSGTTTGSQMDRDMRLREVIQEIATVQLGGEHVTKGGKAIDWTIGNARAVEDRPEVITIGFRQSGMAYAYNFADEGRPRVYVTSGAFDDPSRFNFNSANLLTRATRDTDRSGKVNFSMPMTFGSTSGTLKAGLSARLKERSNRDTATVFTSALGTNSLGATAATLFSRLATDARPRSVFDGRYNMGRHTDPDAVRAFFANDRSAFTVNSFSSTTTTAGASFEVNEDVYAGYLMATLDVGKFQLIPGVRVEATQVENSANRVAIDGDKVTVTRVTGSSSYTNFFPSVNAAWRLDEYTNIKGAVTTSLVRPQFRDMAPYVNVQAGEQVASIGNPDLKATTALAFDLMAERYFQSVGFVAAGVFMKDLENFIFPTIRPRRADEELGPDATQVVQPANGPTARLYGFELAWQQNLSFLAPSLKYVSVNMNYTYTRSDAKIEGLGREGVTTPLPGQTGNASNVGVFYDRGPLSLRVGTNYSGDFLSTINPQTPEGDTRTRERLQVDLSGSYQLRPGVKLFGEFINLTNTPLRAYVGNQLNRGGGGDDPSYEFYKSWGMVGIRIDR
jgi:TonB-dependent receptor